MIILSVIRYPLAAYSRCIIVSNSRGSQRWQMPVGVLAAAAVSCSVRETAAMVTFSVVVAATHKGCIGISSTNSLPWSIPEVAVVHS